MARDRTIQACAAGVIALCLCVSTWLSVMMTATAGQAEMTYTDRAEDNDRWEVSAGLAMLREGEDASALLHRADAALFRAKRSGRNASTLAS